MSHPKHATVADLAMRTPGLAPWWRAFRALLRDDAKVVGRVPLLSDEEFAALGGDPATDLAWGDPGGTSAWFADDEPVTNQALASAVMHLMYRFDLGPYLGPLVCPIIAVIFEHAVASGREEGLELVKRIASDVRGGRLASALE